MLRSLVMSFLVFVGTAVLASAQGTGDRSPIPESRLLIERDVDFFGADLRSLFDTTFEACQAACTADRNCTAFTFNSRSNSCFPKRGVDRREPYAGAVSALVIPATEDALALAIERSANLPFLSSSDLARARTLASGVWTDRQPGDAEADILQEAAAGAREANNPGNAIAFTRRALALRDDARLWRLYSRDALAYRSENRQRQSRIRDAAIPAAINAYLRAQGPWPQADALLALAEALEAARRGRDGLAALRLAADVQPSDAVLAALDVAIGKYGFRVTGSQADNESAAPRICATFSEPLQDGVDFAPYVRLPGVSFDVTADGQQLCLDGLAHGQRYRPTFRAGLPAASGEQLIKDTTLALYVRDRSARVTFPGRAYVLPRGPAPVLPVRTVNTETVNLALYRVAERSLRQMIEDDYFGRPLNTWEADRFAESLSEELWTGTGDVERVLNTEVTTLLPLDDAVSNLEPGVYAMRADVPGADPYQTSSATQWFVVSDLGLSTTEGADGIVVRTRSLATAQPMSGVTVRLVSRGNRILAETVTDPDGNATFATDVTEGRGGAAPSLVLASLGDKSKPDDFAFLSLTEPAFDLSDRGVEGRAPAGAVDAFLATDRGAYRAGETIHATVLSRDPKAKAIVDLPLTAILTRPDGVEFTRLTSDGGIAGGHVFSLPLPDTAPRGTWALAIHLDPDAPALTRQRLLVEDFLPERIDVTLSTPESFAFGGANDLDLQVDYLFGAPGGDLPIEGEVVLRAAETLGSWPGYRFGLYDEIPEPIYTGLSAQRTDAQGAASVTIGLPVPETEDRPFEAVITARVSEGSGRPVERQTTVPVAAAGALIGIKPNFDSVVPEGGEAAFQVIGLDETAASSPMTVRWTLNRVERRYQWYQRYGNWQWEPTTRRTRVASGETRIDGPTELAAAVDWGQYELVVERIDGPYAAASTAFYAGWYAATEGSSSPDRLDVSLDAQSYRVGDTARLRIVPQAPGQVRVAVMGSTMIAETEVSVEGPTVVDLPVTDAWGAGAYVTATLYRPVAEAGQRLPTRALGLAYAQIDPGAAKLDAQFDVLAQVAPREPLDVALKVAAPSGAEVWATIAAVDVGILNITAHGAPKPADHYFGQARLGVTLRDLYGRLIETNSGTLGRIRSGGDATAGLRMEAPPPTEDLVAFFSGPLRVGPDGIARTQFDLPSFNGTVRLMAVVWSKEGVGQAQADVLVRDPVVLTASVPRFMTPGDTAQMRLDIVHAEGPTGAVTLTIAGDGVRTDQTDFSVDLQQQARATIPVRLTADALGLASLDLTLTTPAGRVLTKSLNVPVQISDPEIAATTRLSLDPGAAFSLSSDIFSGTHPGSAAATVALGPLARFDVPGLLSALDRYPYGCTEQVISRALPLLTMAPLSAALDLADEAQARTRLDQAIATVLSRQTSGGGFGLWASYDGDAWLDAFATDFLGRARAAGHKVPDQAMERALDALRNAVNSAPDFDANSNGGGVGLAYALYVLAREGAASLGDLRYFADVKGEDFPTPLAKGQVAAALAIYGEEARADRLFASAEAQINAEAAEPAQTTWRADYGSRIRDTAAVLTLASEAQSTAVARSDLAAQLAQPERRLSTQETLWTLLAASSLAEDVGTQMSVNGTPAAQPLLRFPDTGLVGTAVEIRNTGREVAELTVTSYGVPTTPPAAGGNGYGLTRNYYTLDGTPVDPAQVTQGTRLVAVLTVQPFGKREARLMVVDPLPAGFEIDNPNLLRGGDIAALDWLDLASARNTEFRQDAFRAAVDWRSDKRLRLAYIVRAVTPGTFYHAAASVEDMYRPQYRANTASGRIAVVQ